MTEPGGRRRVRRRRPGADDQPEAPVPGPPKPRSPAPAPTSSATPHKPGRTDRPASTGEKPERSLRGLIGAGPTQVSVSAAMRARDAARPDDDDLAAAERDLTIVRRHYDPDTDSGQRRSRKPKKDGS